MSSTPDPSSLAARSAQFEDDDPEASRPGFFSRLFGAGSDDTAEQDTSSDSNTEPSKNGGATSQFGMSNLRRMRIEDVSVPRAEIQSVPCDISLEDR